MATHFMCHFHNMIEFWCYRSSVFTVDSEHNSHDVVITLLLAYDFARWNTPRHDLLMMHINHECFRYPIGPWKFCQGCLPQDSIKCDFRIGTFPHSNRKVSIPTFVEFASHETETIWKKQMIPQRFGNPGQTTQRQLNEATLAMEPESIWKDLLASWHAELYHSIGWYRFMEKLLWWTDFLMRFFLPSLQYVGKLKVPKPLTTNPLRPCNPKLMVQMILKFITCLGGKWLEDQGRVGAPGLPTAGFRGWWFHHDYSWLTPCFFIVKIWGGKQADLLPFVFLLEILGQWIQWTTQICIISGVTNHC